MGVKLNCYLSQISEKTIVGAMIVGAMIVGAMIVGAMIVGAMIVGAMIVGAMIVGAMIVGAMRLSRTKTHDHSRPTETARTLKTQFISDENTGLRGDQDDIYITATGCQI